MSRSSGSKRTSTRVWVLVAAVFVLLIVGAAGTVAFASGGASSSGNQAPATSPKHAQPATFPKHAHRPRVQTARSPMNHAPATFPKNAQGLSYGSEAGLLPSQSPDLIQVVATNGKTGYCRNSDLNPPQPKTLAEAAQWDKAHEGKITVLPVYESDGTTQIGVFFMGGGHAVERAAPTN